jgi:hypothetical protein
MAGGQDIILMICGLVIAAALTIFGTAKIVNWVMPSGPYGGTAKGTGARLSLALGEAAQRGR